MLVSVLDISNTKKNPAANGVELQYLHINDYSKSVMVHPVQKVLLETQSKWVYISTDEETDLTALENITQELQNIHPLALCPRIDVGALKTRIIGIRKIPRGLPLLFDRRFLLDHFNLIQKQNGVFELLRIADKAGSVSFYTTTRWNSEKPDIYTYLRPTLTHITNRLTHTIIYSLKIFKKITRLILGLPIRLFDKLISFFVRLTQSPKSHETLSYSSGIPVFIITRDRLEPLKRLVQWLVNEGMENIIFIDNDSSNPKLISYLSRSKFEVIYLNKNIGHKSPWIEGITSIYAKNLPFIVTDPDVIPDEAAHGAVKTMVSILNKYPNYHKVGLGLHIDDLPECYDLRDKVISWEKQFWEKELEQDVYEGAVDTTFALYRPFTKYVLEPSLRTGGRFMARHDPWYEDSKNPSADLVYYKEHASPLSNTWGLGQSDTNSLYR
jgi:hypothetical protein